jgi:hypothetical protein
MTARPRPFKIVIDDSLGDEEADLGRIHVDGANRKQVTRRLLELIGDRFGEEFDEGGVVPSLPGHTVAEVLDTMDRAAATEWELIGPSFAKPTPAYVALAPASPEDRLGTRPFWITFDRLDRRPESRPVASVEVHAKSRTTLVDGLLRGLHVLFDPAMELRTAALSPADEDRSFGHFRVSLRARPTHPRASGA